MKRTRWCVLMCVYASKIHTCLNRQMSCGGGGGSSKGCEYVNQAQGVDVLKETGTVCFL